jgi:hypothetical protein
LLNIEWVQYFFKDEDWLFWVIKKF